MKLSRKLSASFPSVCLSLSLPIAVSLSLRVSVLVCYLIAVAVCDNDDNDDDEESDIWLLDAAIKGAAQQTSLKLFQFNSKMCCLLCGALNK